MLKEISSTVQSQIKQALNTSGSPPKIKREESEKTFKLPSERVKTP